MNSSAAIIVAAGDGTRLPGDTPKAYRLLAGASVLEYSIKSLSKVIDIKNIVIAFNPQHEEWAGPLRRRNPELRWVAGGSTRQASVLNALNYLKSEGYRHALIHDAARPFVSEALMRRVMDALQTEKAVIPAIPVVDTIKRVAEGYAAQTLERDSLMAAQTPQGFDFQSLLAWHEKYATTAVTDDAALAELEKEKIKIIEGDKSNFKLTTLEDWEMAVQRCEQRKTRVGMGFDVHRLIPADARGVLRLCGVDIPSPLKLEGHSDGDVGLHAITDAIFGALALGDLGQHFSDDPKWKGANSEIFLSYSKKLADEANVIVEYVDVTLIAQQPRISPHREAMRQRIAEILMLPLESVSVKATTTDGLGFTGRGEGIAAQAVVTVSKGKQND